MKEQIYIICWLVIGIVVMVLGFTIYMSNGWYTLECMKPYAELVNYIATPLITLISLIYVIKQFGEQIKANAEQLEVNRLQIDELKRNNSQKIFEELLNRLEVVERDLLNLSRTSLNWEENQLPELKHDYIKEQANSIEQIENTIVEYQFNYFFIEYFYDSQYKLLYKISDLLNDFVAILPDINEKKKLLTSYQVECLERKILDITSQYFKDINNLSSLIHTHLRMFLESQPNVRIATPVSTKLMGTESIEFLVGRSKPINRVYNISIMYHILELLRRFLNPLEKSYWALIEFGIFLAPDPLHDFGTDNFYPYYDNIAKRLFGDYTSYPSHLFECYYKNMNYTYEIMPKLNLNRHFALKNNPHRTSKPV